MAYAGWTRYDVSGCPQRELISVSAKLMTKEPSVFWLITTKQNEDMASRYEIEDEVHLEAQQFLADSNLIELYDNGQIKYQIQCSKEITLNRLPEPALAFKNTTSLPSNRKVQLMSLSLEPVRVYSSQGIELAKLQHRGERSELQLPLDQYILSNSRFAAWSDSQDSDTASEWEGVRVDFKFNKKGKRYFEVRNKENTESYVIELSDPDLIRKAEQAIANNKKYLVVAEITSGHGHFNQDLSQKNHPAWSWHPSRVLDINDFASIECDGSPSLVERFLKTKLQNPKICFWNYYISRPLN